MRFSTSETSRSVVLDLKLGWLLLEGLTFADFQERMSAFVVLQHFHWWVLSRDHGNSFSSTFNSIWFFLNCLMVMQLRSLRFASRCSACGPEHLNSAFEFGMLRICQNIKFLSERFSNLLRLLLPYNSACTKNENYIVGLTMLCEFEDFSWWLEEECFAPPLSRLMIEWECPKFNIWI